MLAFGRLARNGFCSVEVVLVVRKFCMMGPQRPNGSNAKARRMLLVLRRSSMIWSPWIDCADDVLELTFVLSRLYFSRSLFWRCRSAMAVNFC